ncbi:Uncharacterised protein [Weissella viridescens]|uniref:Uncharacterized protein n=1 Tax=Weissella viridescens TaxID=1629 RepID=A0A380P364_WEIVI|nr:Uncharacterised protein [Weissella viridescens]
MTVNQPRADAKSQITHKAQKAQKLNMSIIFIVFHDHILIIL